MNKEVEKAIKVVFYEDCKKCYFPKRKCASCVRDNRNKIKKYIKQLEQKEIILNKEGRKMKSNELFEQIHSGQIKDNTKISVINELTGNCITEIEYKNQRLNWVSGEFDTSFLCNIDIDFEVIEENKEIDIQSIKEISSEDRFYRTDNIDKLNELTRAIKQIDKELNELKSLDYLEISERDINDAIKRAREYMDKERERE